MKLKLWLTSVLGTECESLLKLTSVTTWQDVIKSSCLYKKNLVSVNINYKICIKACCKIQLHMSKPNLRLVSGYTLLTYMILLVFHPYFFVFSFLDIKQHFLWVFFSEIWKIMLLFYFSRVVFPKDYKCRLIWWWHF